MQSLNSKNYEKVQVYIRGEENPFDLSALAGVNLMEFLTDPNTQSTHVKLNDMDGSTIVVKRSDISKVVPVYIKQSVSEMQEQMRYVL